MFQTNTVNSDVKFKAELQNSFNGVSDNHSIPLVDIDLLRRCLSKMKLKKCPGFDNVSTEHLIYAGIDLHVHLCLLFNVILNHSYVPREFAYGLIIPSLKDKHGDQTRIDMYRAITLSPVI